MIKTSFYNSQKLPLVVEPDGRKQFDSDSLGEICVGESAFFEEKILKHGALLLRGFGLQTTAEFERFVREFSGADLFDYAGGVSPRKTLSPGGVYTSTEYPAQYALSLHNELSYAGVYPRRLYFFCVTPAENGGETTLGDSRRILNNIDAAMLEKFRRKDVCYVRNLQADKGSGYSWQDAFAAADRREIERRCREIGAQFLWKPNGGLRLSQTRPATAAHPQTGEEVWFNQADGFHPSNLDAETYRELISFFGTEDEFRLNAFYGDGSAIEPETLAHVRAVLRAETIPHKWQTGDILILDNLLAAHGRMPFTGARKIALAMT